MSKQEFNFNLGNRSLTEDESAVVVDAMRQLQDSLNRLERVVHGHKKTRENSKSDYEVAKNKFKTMLNAAASTSVSRPRDTDVVTGSAVSEVREWRTNKVVLGHRRY